MYAPSLMLPDVSVMILHTAAGPLHNFSCLVAKSPNYLSPSQDPDSIRRGSAHDEVSATPCNNIRLLQSFLNHAWYDLYLYRQLPVRDDRIHFPAPVSIP